MSYRKILSLLFITFALASCGGGGSVDDTSGGGGDGNITPVLPADAVQITDSNAIVVAESAVDNASSGGLLLGVEVASPPVSQVIKSIKSTVHQFKQTQNIATGVTAGPFPCDGGSGTFTFSGTVSTTGSDGTITFNNCVGIDGTTIDGSINFTSTWNDNTGAYSDNVSGSLTVTYLLDTFTMSLSISETGNDDTGEFSTNITYSVSGTNLGGFLVETLQTVKGNYFNGVLYSGQLLVTGKNGSRLRITVISSSTASVELDTGDGIWVNKGTVNIYF